MSRQLITGVIGRSRKGIDIPTDYLAAWDFNTDFSDKSVNSNHLDLITAANTVTIQPTSDGVRTINAANFSNGYLISSKNVEYNNDIVTTSLWIKSIATATEFIYQSRNEVIGVLGTLFSLVFPTGQNPNYKSFVASHFGLAESASAENNYTDGIDYNDDIWRHLVIQYLRNQGYNQLKLYINGQLTSTIHTLNGSPDMSGNFISDNLRIGRRSNNTLPFSGQLAKFKIYNRALNQEEITALYNEI